MNIFLFQNEDGLKPTKSMEGAKTNHAACQHDEQKLVVRQQDVLVAWIKRQGKNFTENNLK